MTFPRLISFLKFFVEFEGKDHLFTFNLIERAARIDVMPKTTSRLATILFHLNFLTIICIIRKLKLNLAVLIMIVGLLCSDRHCGIKLT